MINKNYKKLTFYQDIREIVILVYNYTKKFPKEELGFTGIVNQLRRASISAASNVAEGSSRDEKEFFRFLKISLGSLREVETQIEISYDLNFITKVEFENLQPIINRALGKLSKYIKYVGNTAYKLEKEKSNSNYNKFEMYKSVD